MKVLIVDDEPKTSDYLRRGLTEEGWITEHARSGPEALCLAQACHYDAIIMEVDLPAMDGFEVLTRLRETHETPVIILTVRDHIDDRVRGLRCGADDYLLKPFSFLELLARLGSITRRHRPQQKLQLAIGDLRIDFLARHVSRGRRRLTLTPKEFAILEVLARRRSHVVSKTVIAELVWNISFEATTNAVEVGIRRLRAKLELSDEEKLIHTVWGMGYVLESRSAAGT